MGGYVLVVKFTGGGELCPSCKIHRGGGDYVHVYKNEQGRFCPGGIMSVSRTVLPETHEVERLIERKNNHNKVVHSKLC